VTFLSLLLMEGDRYIFCNALNLKFSSESASCEKFRFYELWIFMVRVSLILNGKEVKHTNLTS